MKFSPRTHSASTSARVLALAAAAAEDSPCPCEILRGRKSIGKKNRNVLPGERINLSVKCDDGDPTEMVWEIPETSFASYTLTTDKAELTKLSDNDLHQPSISFCWADCGKDKEVKVSFKIGQRSCSAKVTFHVVCPKSVFTVDYIGQVKLNPTSDALQLLPNQGENAGIRFKAKVYYIPEDRFPEGTWGFVRTVKDDFVVKNNVSTECSIPLYPNEIVADASQPKTPGPTGMNEVRTDADSPGVALLGANIVYSRSSPCFHQYVMFKPKDGDWVPLKVIAWRVYGCVEGTTIKGTPGASATSAVVTSRHPQWAHSISPGSMYTNGPCPNNPGCENWTPQDCQ